MQVEIAKKSWEKFGLAFDSGLKLISDAPGKKSPIHLWLRVDLTDKLATVVLSRGAKYKKKEENETKKLTENTAILSY